MAIMFSKSTFEISGVANVPFSVRFAFDEVNMEHKGWIIAELMLFSRVKSLVRYWRCHVIAEKRLSA
jgi:hypothetical protein